jgi:hypothetical protein
MDATVDGGKATETRTAFIDVDPMRMRWGRRRASLRLYRRIVPEPSRCAIPRLSIRQKQLAGQDAVSPQTLASAVTESQKKEKKRQEMRPWARQSQLERMRGMFHIRSCCTEFG